MTSTEIQRFISETYGGMIADAGLKHRHRPEVLAGIIMRETQGGLSPLLDQPGPEGRGDRDEEGRYHSRGLCQIDDCSFPGFCSGLDWKERIGEQVMLIYNSRPASATIKDPKNLVAEVFIERPFLTEKQLVVKI